MNNQICDVISYVGVNDHFTQLFEGLWPLPKGVSYNSYVIRGETSTALADTVSIEEFPEFMHNLEALDREPSYLIVHHMEPDHSGSIPQIVNRFPGIKIVANKIAIGMIKGFYHLDSDDLFIEVKDGDTLDLGGDCILRFVMTPMVHWPETMMTWIESRKTLFSGDAFGTFGGLDNGPLDSGYPDGHFDDEMYRYYACIVGKYSPFVQKAFAKLKDFEVRRICPTHGPVWESRLSHALDMYGRLSLQQPDDGVVIVFGSMYGNTEKMAEKFGALLTERGLEVKCIHNSGTEDMSRILADIWRYKGLVLAAPTYSLDIFPPMESLVKALEIRGLKNKIVASLGNYAWAPKVAAEKMAERMERLGLEVVGKVAMPMSLNPDVENQLASLADEFVAKMKS